MAIRVFSAAMLVACPACASPVSAQAPACPRCGQPIASARPVAPVVVKPTIWESRNGGAVGCLVIVLFGAAVFLFLCWR